MSGTPTDLREVTAPWLASVLGGPVDAVDVQLIAAGEGFMGRLARVRVTSSDPGVPALGHREAPHRRPGRPHDRRDDAGVGA